MELSEKHAKMLRFIRRRAAQGDPASVSAIMAHCDIRREATVWGYIQDLAAAGLIEYRTPRPAAAPALEV